jgi:hypothetical protein
LIAQWIGSAYDRSITLGAGMSEDHMPYGISPAEAAELRELFTELPDVSAAAAEALNNADAAPIGFALERFNDLDAYVAAIIKRIRAILLR